MKILIVKTSSIGDIIHTFPVAEALRKQFPKAQIDWVVEKGNAALVRAHPEITHVYEIDTRLWRKKLFTLATWKQIQAFKRDLQSTSYDLLFDLQGNTKSACVTFLAKAKEKIGFGWDTVRERPNMLVTNKRYSVPQGVNVRERNLYPVRKHLSDLYHLPRKVSLSLTPEEQKRLGTLVFPSPTYMVAFGSKWKNKRLKPEILQEFLAKLDAHFLFIWANEEEKVIAEQLGHAFPKSMLLGNLSLPFWQAVMQKVDLVIAMDSAALHLAATTSTPTFSVFGPTLASVFKPEGKEHISVQGTCPYNKTFSAHCPILRTCKTGACLHNITVDELYKALNNSEAVTLPRIAATEDSRGRKPTE